MQASPERGQVTRGLGLVTLVILAGFGVYRFGQQAVYPIAKGSVGADFAVFQDGARAIVRGTPLYPQPGLPLTYMYPPTLAIMLVPVVDRPGALFLFMAGAAVAVLGTILLLARFASADWYSVGAVLGAAALCAWPVHLLLRQGQVDSYTVLLMVATLLLVWRGRPGLGALPLALAIGLKFTPGVLLLYFGWKKRYRLVAQTLLATVCLLGLEALVVGLPTVVGYFSQVVPRIGTEGHAYWYNQSLHATFLRLFAANEYTEPVADLGVGVVVSASATSLLLLLVLTLLVVPRSWPQSAAVYLAEAGAFMILEIIGASLSWQMHAVWLLVPVGALLLAAQQGLPAPRWFGVLAGLAVLGFVYGPFEPPFEYGRFAHGWWNLLISHTLWAALALLGLCLYLVRNDRLRPRPVPRSEPGAARRTR
ncbi:MAG: glycosyltransferase 87 family protein [Chloroflexota bacterium]|nr:glycosyltransferase 87 family protein [Chloroflexota bacterium]